MEMVKLQFATVFLIGFMLITACSRSDSSSESEINRLKEENQKLKALIETNSVGQNRSALGNDEQPKFSIKNPVLEIKLLKIADGYAEYGYKEYNEHLYSIIEYVRPIFAVCLHFRRYLCQVSAIPRQQQLLLPQSSTWAKWDGSYYLYECYA